MNINSALVDVVDVEQPADVVEFCPIPTCENILACGTYLLNERERSKTGKILLYQCSNKPSTLVEVNRVDTPAILDLRWFVILLFILFCKSERLRTSSKEFVCAACSDSCVWVLEFDPITKRLVVAQKAKGLSADMILAIDLLPPRVQRFDV